MKAGVTAGTGKSRSVRLEAVVSGSQLIFLSQRRTWDKFKVVGCERWTSCIPPGRGLALKIRDRDGDQIIPVSKENLQGKGLKG